MLCGHHADDHQVNSKGQGCRCQAALTLSLRRDSPEFRQAEGGGWGGEVSQPCREGSAGNEQNSIQKSIPLSGPKKERLGTWCKRLVWHQEKSLLELLASEPGDSSTELY